MKFKVMRYTKILRANMCEEARDEILVYLDWLIQRTIMSNVFSYPRTVRNVKEGIPDTPRKLVDIKEYQGSIRTSTEDR